MMFSDEIKEKAILKAIDSDESLIEIGFQKWASTVWNGTTISKVQYTECKRAFFSGFIENFSLIVNSVDILSQEDSEKLFDKVKSDREKWIDELKEESRKKNDS